MSRVIEKLPQVPAKPINGMIVVKRSIEKDPKAEEKSKDKKQAHEGEPFAAIFINEIYDIGSCKEESLGFGKGQKVNVLTYGNEVVTAEEDSETHDICYFLINPASIVGLYE